MELLTVSNVRKVYTTRFGGQAVEALRNVNFSVEKGNMWPSWENPAPEKPRF